MIDTTRMRAALVNGYMYVGGTYDAALEYEHYEGAILALCDEVDRLRAELDAERERNRWIPVGERLPENNTEVLLLAHVRSFEDWTKRRTRIFLGSHNNKTWICDGDMIFNGVNRIYDYASVTHWRELPEPPECEHAAT